MAIGPWLDPQVLDDAKADSRAGLEVSTDADEHAIRLQAIALIDDAHKLFKGPLPGMVTRALKACCGDGQITRSLRTAASLGQAYC
jgi:hypothetical protein